MPLPMRKKKGTVAALQIHQDQGVEKSIPFTRSKRRSDGSPEKHPSKKRHFGDITNAIVAKKESFAKKSTLVKAITKKSIKTEAKTSSIPKPVVVKQEVKVKEEPMSVEGDCLEDSLEIILSQVSGSSQSSSSQSSSQSSIKSEVDALNEKNRLISDTEIKDAVAAISIKEETISIKKETISIKKEPLEYDDIDEENKEDPNQSPVYAQDIFEYLKEKENECQIKCYFNAQSEVTKHMRAVLVDWMVEVQENFELNHETLYLAVKLVDLYLMKTKVSRDMLQLLGATGLFIACKFDERCPPALDDYIYICDDAYDRQQFIDMEMVVLRQVDFNLGIPLSYRFLRRYAKCCHASMQTLTLARFILEMSLMHSQFMEIRDSLLASSTLLLAFKMMKTGSWNPTLEHYSGFQEIELLGCMSQLNSMLKEEPNKSLATIRNKYSHKVFYEVATIAPLPSITYGGPSIKLET